MLHVFCTTLIVVVALAEMSMMRQWTREQSLHGVQQAAVAAALRSNYERRN